MELGPARTKPNDTPCEKKEDAQVETQAPVEQESNPVAPHEEDAATETQESAGNDSNPAASSEEGAVTETTQPATSDINPAATPFGIAVPSSGPRGKAGTLQHSMWADDNNAPPADTPTGPRAMRNKSSRNASNVRGSNNHQPSRVNGFQSGQQQSFRGPPHARGFQMPQGNLNSRPYADTTDEYQVRLAEPSGSPNQQHNFWRSGR